MDFSRPSRTPCARLRAWGCTPVFLPHGRLTTPSGFARCCHGSHSSARWAGSTRRARRTGTHIHRHPRRLPDQPVLISVHSTGRAAEVVDLIERHQHPGIILHWFLGTDDLRDRAHAAGAYLSVNQAMSDAILQAVPIDGLLPETDFPARQVGAHIPGAIAPLEKRLCGIWGRSAVEVRQQLWTNLKTIAIASGAIDVVSEELADRLVAF